MKRISKLGSVFFLIILFASFCIPLLTYTPKASAYDSEGALYYGNDKNGQKDINNLGGGDAARDRISAALTATFVDIGHINVELSLTDPVFTRSDIDVLNNPQLTFSTAFSGLYSVSEDKTEWYATPKLVRQEAGSETGIYVSAMVKSHVATNLDLRKASTKEINDWLSKGMDFYAIVYARDSGNGAASQLYVLADEKSDGLGLKWAVECYNSRSELSTCEQDENNGPGGIPQKILAGEFNFRDEYSGVPIKNLNINNSKFLYTYLNQSIVSNFKVDNKAITYAFCENVLYFQEGSCGSNGQIIFNDPATKNPKGLAWGNTAATIAEYFNNDVANPAKLSNLTKSSQSDILILGSQSTSGQLAGIGTSSNKIELQCDFAPLNPLSWFMCPLINGAVAGINSLDTLINGEMNVPVGDGSTFDQASSTAGGNGTYKAWSAMRSMALALLVVIALVMVISQAIGSGPFDAYTVKKVMPRLVIAVIFTALSWQICKLLISISNDLGKGIGSILSASFSGIKNPRISGSATGGSTISAVAAIAGFFSGIDILVILSLVLTALAGVFIAFLVIAFRRMLIILLVISAPIAIISWILPNTQKLWKFWKESLQGALLAFPIIIAFITIGRVFASISSNDNSSPTLFRDIITFIAYFGPYFALPAAFKLAGGAVATIGGMANDRSKGFFDRNRKFRDAKKKEAVHRREAGALFKGAKSTGFRSRMNKITAGAYATKTLGYDPRRWKGQMHAAHTNHSVAGSQEMLQDKEFARVAGDDNWNYAASVAKDDNDFRAIMKSFGRSDHSIEEDLGHYKNMMGKYGRDAVKLASFEKTAAGGTVYGTEGRMSSIDAAQRIADGNSGMQAYLDGRIRGISAQAGRPDEGMLNHGAAMAISNMARSGMWMDDKGQYTDANGNVLADQKSGIAHGLSADAISDLVARRSFEQSHGSQWMAPNVKGHATKKGIKMLKSDLENSIASGSTAGLAQSIVKLDQMVSAASSPEKTALLAEGITSQRLSDAQITALQDNPEFMKMYGDRLYEQKRVVSYDEVSGERVESVVRGDFRKDLTYSDLLNLSRGTREVQERSRQYESPYGHAAQPEGAIPTNTIPGAGP